MNKEVSILDYVRMPDGDEKTAINRELFEVTGQSNDSVMFCNALMAIVREQNIAIKSKDIERDSEISAINIARLKQQLTALSGGEQTTVKDVYSTCSGLTRIYKTLIEPAKTSVMMYFSLINDLKNYKTND